VPSENQKATMNRPFSIRGLSALEVMIIVAAIAVIGLITFPGTTLLLEKYRLKTTETSLLKSLEMAKMEAQARSSTVVVCPSSNGNSCRRDNDWSYGWVVFSDGNGNGTVQDIELIHASGAPNARIRIFAEGATQSRAAFTSTGLVSHGDSLTGQFRICLNDSSADPRILEVEADGWIRLVPPVDASCDNG